MIPSIKNTFLTQKKKYLQRPKASTKAQKTSEMEHLQLPWFPHKKYRHKHLQRISAVVAAHLRES